MILTFPVSVSGAQESKSRGRCGREGEQERARDKDSLFHMQVGTVASLPSLPGGCGQSWSGELGVWKRFTTQAVGREVCTSSSVQNALWALDIVVH